MFYIVNFVDESIEEGIESLVPVRFAAAPQNLEIKNNHESLSESGNILYHPKEFTQWKNISNCEQLPKYITGI